jgi:hypothetical protein
MFLLAALPIFEQRGFTRSARARAAFGVSRNVSSRRPAHKKEVPRTRRGTG